MTQSAAIDIRDAFFDELYEIACKDGNVVFLTADTGAWSLGKFKKDIPGRYFNVGISEQNMVSVAAGMALGGKKVFIYAIAPFMTQRCYEQIRIDLSLMNLPVTAIGSGPGLTYSSDGPTHHAIEDLSALRALPNMTILNPCDQVSAQAAARLAHEGCGPHYVRLDKGILPVVYGPDSHFDEGCLLVREGKDLLIVATGIMTHKAVELAENLEAQGVDAAVLDLLRIKPLNRPNTMRAIKSVMAVITLEEHTCIGGIGSAISALITEEGLKIPLKQFAIQDRYSRLYGDREWMQKDMGLDTSTVCRQTGEWFRKVTSRKGRKTPYPNTLTANDFAGMFGIPEDRMPPECVRIIEKTDFRYRIAQGEEKEKLLFQATRILFQDLPVSGAHRRQDWEKGWRENLENFTNRDYDSKELIPKFVKNKAYIRYNREFIYPSNPTFETSFVTVLRSFLFEQYFSPYQSIYEFGCGTGHNLLQLGRRYPDKELYGLDWAASACELVNKIAETQRLNLKAIRFDMFTPDQDLSLGPHCAVFTIGAMEQLGTGFGPFLEFLIHKQVGLCINVETMYEMYDQEIFFDYLAARYLDKRGYLKGFLKQLREEEQQGHVEIIALRKTLSGSFHDGYNYVVWRPVS